jgi:hypothetical protein
MPSITTVAIQSLILKGTANVTAQLVAQHRFVAGEGATPPPFDWARVAEFALYGFVQGHINFWWQHFLEGMFPTTNAKRRRLIGGEDDGGSGSRGSLSYRNLFGKVVVDQTLGLLIMNTTFLTITNVFRLRNLFLILEVIQTKIFKIIFTAWKVWPVVACLNFALFPVTWRPIVAATVGFLWTMYLTFFVAANF